MLACTTSLLSMCSSSVHPPSLFYWWSSCTCPCGGSWSRCLPGAWWVFSCTGTSLVPGLVFGPPRYGPSPEGRQGSSDKAGFTSLAPGFKPHPPGAGVGFPPPGPSLAPPRGKEPVVPSPAPQPGPSLGPSQASLMNALALLSNQRLEPE